MPAASDLRPANLPRFVERDHGEPNGEWLPVAPARWRLLTPPKASIPDPPGYLADQELVASGKELSNEAYGSQRIGRRRRIIELVPAPSEADQFWPHAAPIPPRRPRKFEVITSIRWSSRTFKVAHRAAVRIVLDVGLNPSAPGHWVWQERPGRWWALEAFVDVRAVGEKAEVAYLPSSDFIEGELPAQLVAALGGIDGPLDWALSVLNQVQRVERLREEAKEGLGVLLDLPEWSALKSAAHFAGGGHAATIALGQLEALARGAAVGTLAEALFDEAFDTGEMIGFFAAANAVRHSEATRNQGKIELRKALREIAVAEAKKGTLKPYTLAKVLVAERDGATTERGRHLGALGLAADANRVGVMIREEAMEAGLLRS